MSDSSMEGEHHITIHEIQANAPPIAPPSSIEEAIRMDEHQLNSCLGGTTDRRLYILIVQSLISFVILIVCMYKLFDGRLSCEQSQLYLGLITLITGIWMKSPIDR